MERTVNTGIFSRIVLFQRDFAPKVTSNNRLKKGTFLIQQNDFLKVLFSDTFAITNIF